MRKKIWGAGLAAGVSVAALAATVPAAAAASTAGTATAGTSSTITIPGPLYTTFPGSSPAKAIPGNYFVGFWVAVVDGPGRGQVRKISSYPVDSSGTPHPSAIRRKLLGSNARPMPAS